MERLSASHIAAAQGGFEPQRPNNFIVRITPPGGDAEVIELTIFSCPFPADATEVMRIPYINEERKVAGKTTIQGDGMELVMTDYVDQQVLQTMRQWRRMVFDPRSGRTGLAANYKVEGQLLLFGPEGSMERSWTLIGVWPSALNSGEGSMERATDANRITVTLQVDLAFLDGEPAMVA